MYVDLNADLGESYGRWTLGDDQALIDVVTSANVACGFHAGDPPTLRRVCGWAAQRQVAVGAQVAYRDLAGFGRRFVDADPGELRDDVLYQLGALDAFALAAGTAVSYVKPHGALYNASVTHRPHARAVVDAVAEYADATGRRPGAGSCAGGHPGRVRGGGAVRCRGRGDGGDLPRPGERAPRRAQRRPATPPGSPAPARHGDGGTARLCRRAGRPRGAARARFTVDRHAVRAGARTSDRRRRRPAGPGGR